jgi:hypothetical protein
MSTGVRRWALRINAQDTAGCSANRRLGENSAPINSRRATVSTTCAVTADLWEAHIFDHIALLAVDHPPNTEVWVDERFSFPMPPLRVTVTNTPQPIVRADR